MDLCEKKAGFRRRGRRRRKKLGGSDDGAKGDQGVAASAASVQDARGVECREYTSTRRVTRGFFGLSPVKSGLPNGPSVFSSVLIWAGIIPRKTCEDTSTERGLRCQNVY